MFKLSNFRKTFLIYQTITMYIYKHFVNDIPENNVSRNINKNVGKILIFLLTFIYYYCFTKN